MESNKKTQWRRMCNYFIEATVAIIEEEGINKLTIRKVADRAAFNSATLYNYFENLDELLYFAVLSFMKDYLEELDSMNFEGESKIEIYKEIWISFTEHALTYPEYYYIIFFKETFSIRDDMLETYHDIYPERLNESSSFTTMLSNANLYKRSKVLMDDIIENGELDEEDGRIIDEIVVRTFHSLLRDTRDDDMDRETGVKKLKLYMDYLMDDKAKK